MKAFEAKGLGREDVNTKRIRAQHSVPSMLLEEDARKTMHTLSKSVGGYYESFTVHSTELQALDNVLTVFGRFKPEGKQILLKYRSSETCCPVCLLGLRRIGIGKLQLSQQPMVDRACCSPF